MAYNLLNIAAYTAILMYTLCFTFFRVGELIPVATQYPSQCLSVFTGTVVVSCFLGHTSRKILYIASVLIAIYLIDYYLPEYLPSIDSNHAGKTVVITGANSGVGFETARQLVVNYGVHVIMGCRSKSKCDMAAKAINDQLSTHNKSGKAVPLVVDLDRFESVNSFVSQLRGLHIDVLFNNAGYIPVANLSINKYGLDPSFTSMHLSHFLLTEELVKIHPSLRVVTTSSIGQQLCTMAFHIPKIVLSISSRVPLLPDFIRSTLSLTYGHGCIDDNYLSNNITTPTNDLAYIHAKMANMMHAVEIPKHHPNATSVAIDLGFVGTHILSFMEGALSPTKLKWIRDAEVGVLPMIHAILSSDEELLQGSVEKDRQWSDGGIVMTTLGSTREAFSYPWYDESMDLGRSRMLTLSRQLWNVSYDLIRKHAAVDIGEGSSKIENAPGLI